MVDDTLFVQTNHCDHNIAMTTNVYDLPIISYICFSSSIVALIGLLIYNRKHQLNLNIPGSTLENLSISLLLTHVLFMFAYERPVYGKCVTLSELFFLTSGCLCGLHNVRPLTDDVTRYTTRRGYCP